MKKVNTFLSSNNTNQMDYYIYEPDNKPKYILQIVHGMCEYLERYEPFIRYLNEHDILVCGHDHLGHGKNAPEKGYIADKDGYKYLIEDVHKVSTIIKEQYPNIPYCILGHSMGSFVTRNYLSWYPNEVDGAIIMGTSGPNPLGKIGISVAKMIKSIYGPKHKSKFIDKLAFGSYNKGFEAGEPSAWISSDSEVYHAYDKDELCNFKFSISGYIDLFTMLDLVSSKKWACEVAKNLPIYVVSGDKDPVGGYGKGVIQVFHMLTDVGRNADMKLYPQMRHEILNEINKEEVYLDILNFMERNL